MGQLRVAARRRDFSSEVAWKNQTESLQDQYALALRELEERAEGEFIIGGNLKMKGNSGLISKVAPTPTTVLIRRRERDRERAGGASNPPQQHAQQSPFGDSELHGVVSSFAGKRTLWLPARRFYGRL